jgi:hypothetical protein
LVTPIGASSPTKPGRRGAGAAFEAGAGDEPGLAEAEDLLGDAAAHVADG